MRATDHRHYADQRSYTTAEVEHFLPSVFDPDWILSARPPRADTGDVKTKADPRHIPDFILAAADTQVAYRRAGLTHTEKECLRHVHHLGYSPAELGSFWDVQPERVHMACREGVEKLTRYMNGATPA